MWEVENPNTPNSGSPRDERFYTPRSMTRNNSSGGSSDGWRTPREVARSSSVGNAGGNSDSEYRTPRVFSEGEDNYSFMSSRSGNYDHSNPPALSPPRSSSGATFPNRKMLEDEELSTGVDKDDLDALFRFARHDRYDDIERLFTMGIPVDVRDEHGNTVLIIACQNGNKRIAKGALRRGANMNARNLKGNTPLHYCFHFGYGDSLGQYLISKGADTSVRNSSGKLCWEGI